MVCEDALFVASSYLYDSQKQGFINEQKYESLLGNLPYLLTPPSNLPTTLR